MGQWYSTRLESVLPSGFPGSIPGAGVGEHISARIPRFKSWSGRPTFMSIFRDAFVNKIIIPNRKTSVIREDPDDNMILECAIEGNVDYLITNDNHLLKLKEFEGIKIVNPIDFLNILTSE